MKNECPLCGNLMQESPVKKGEEICPVCHWNDERFIERKKCPCCGYYTIFTPEEIIVDICPVCFWQYDEVGHDKPDVAVGGPNRDVSLNQARENYKKFGAYHIDVKQFVREPTEEEKVKK